MNILIIDNSIMVERNGQHYTNNLNGLFISELISLGNNLIYYQFEENRTDSISAFCLEDNGVHCVSVSCKRNKVIRYISAYWNLFPEIRKVDFVYFYYPNTFKFATYICRLLGKPYGLYIRGMNGIDDVISHNNYKHAFTVFTVSDYFTNRVNSLVGKSVANTIRPMIPYTDQDIIRNRQYIPKDSYNILFLGRVAKDKGILELTEAAKQLHIKGRKFIIHIVGNGEYSEELETTIRNNNLSDYIILDGPVYDDHTKAELYQAADLYVLPTYHEGFPRTLYEAMIFGTPIITTFVGGIPSLMKDGENCKRIEPKSTESVLDALAFAMDHYDTMARYAINAVQIVTKVVDHKRLSHAQHLNQILQRYGK